MSCSRIRIRTSCVLPSTLKTSAHLWMQDVEVVQCIADPRCIAKEHYVAPEGTEDLSIDVPDEERGVIPHMAIRSHGLRE